ncbi:MAG: amidase [Burkholderiales bacterium]|jgi:Asp-tRNA(Asn)/Glu-tRNA(Gln) amidotransferase A subunit family amidase
MDVLKLIDDIQQRDREIGAFVAFAKSTSSPIDGQFQAKNAENALQDWTFAVKSNIAVAGLAHTAGIGGYRDRIASEDAFCVARLRAAGAGIIGTVNMEEAALGAVTSNPHFGKTHNPLRHGYTAGGSSGGSAAAVAARMVRAALGTDTMGSCRIPAAYCGVVGFKPSYGRISMRGVEPLSRRLDHVGILANTATDVRDVFAVLDSFDANDAGARRYNAKHETSVKPVRLAVLDEASRAGLDADVRRDYEGALDQIAGAGYQLTERAVDQAKLAAARRAGLLICEAELSVTLADLLAKDDGGVSANLRKLIAFGAAKSAADISNAHAAIDATAAVLREQLSDVDAVCWPTAPQTAFAFSAPVPANQADFTCLANFTGAPAISLPMPCAPSNMPSGLQLMMASGEDEALLNLAEMLATIVESNRRNANNKT